MPRTTVRKYCRLDSSVDLASVREVAGAIAGLIDATELLLGESRKRVPIEEGTLERSGQASVDEGSLVGAVSYGTPYGVYQHERLDLRHDQGRTAKYLEGPAVEQAPVMAALMRAALRRALEGGPG
ncbi:MAG TPA: hypothetical protein VGL93_10535 [Streptosporangiaceae bacterium]|jgi:hypothetical protein